MIYIFIYEDSHGTQFNFQIHTFLWIFPIISVPRAGEFLMNSLEDLHFARSKFFDVYYSFRFNNGGARDRIEFRGYYSIFGNVSKVTKNNSFVFCTHVWFIVLVPWKNHATPLGLLKNTWIKSGWIMWTDWWSHNRSNDYFDIKQLPRIAEESDSLFFDSAPNYPNVKQ